MESLLEHIHAVEQKHLDGLYRHIDSCFASTRLPSHNAQHHLRVWLHCRGLIIELHKAGIEIPSGLVENAIVACFFHDLGLTVNIGEMHGQLGAQMCRDYFRQHPDIPVRDMDAVAQAIALHDDKTAKQGVVSSPTAMLCLNRLVSTADDLDAIGVVGIFRYTEIYLKRGIPDSELPKKVLKNLKNRFTSFTSAYSSLHRFTDRQRLRYLDTMNFFTELDLQMAVGASNPDSAMAVFGILKEQLVEKGKTAEETVDYAMGNLTASYPLQFFRRLRDELNVTSAMQPS